MSRTVSCRIHTYSHHRRCGHGHSQQAAVAGWIAAKYRRDMLITGLCCHYTYKDKEEDLYTADATRIEEVLKVQPRISIVLSWTQQQHNLNRFMRQPIHPKLRQMLIVNVCVWSEGSPLMMPRTEQNLLLLCWPGQRQSP